MNRIDVDFNARGHDGLVRISRRRAESDFVVGDVVELFDAAEPDMNFQALVVEADGGRGWARVSWADPLPSWNGDLWMSVTLDGLVKATTHTVFSQSLNLVPGRSLASTAPEPLPAR